MIIITGGAGFIGSNLVKGFNMAGLKDILIVDNLENGKKIYNLADLDIQDYLDREDFLKILLGSQLVGNVEAIFHLGAHSATTEWDGHFIMKNNYEYSKYLLHWCMENNTAFIYASSASVYGNGTKGFSEKRRCEHPLNAYAFSKFQFDQYVRRLMPAANTQIVGLRYFNVYGPRENHKGQMASTALHFYKQIRSTGTAQLFEGSDGYANGEQKRDFISVDDCVDINLWFFKNRDKRGIFNCGTGKAQSFNQMAEAVIRQYGKGRIEYVGFPEHLRGVYQSFTQADITSLRQIGYQNPFRTLEEGVSKYVDWNRKHSELLV